MIKNSGKEGKPGWIEAPELKECSGIEGRAHD